MGILGSITGTCLVQITSASTSEILSLANKNGIVLYNIAYVNDLSIQANIYRHEFNLLKKLLIPRGSQVEIIKRKGIYWKIKGLIYRPVLLVGLTILLALVLFLPTRVMFYQVEGNVDIPARLIIEKASQCGIEFLASRRDVRSERVKNALLSAIPELQWVGVNTYGCTAIITVKERTASEHADKQTQINSIVASRDGIIQELTVTQGNPLCKVGQAVKKGQILVSAYTDCGISIRAQSAVAEISALTFRNFQSVTPTICHKRTDFGGTVTHYALRIGKNIINFCKDSGISDTRCVKMYSEYTLTLPGGFTLPVVLVKIQEHSYVVKEAQLPEEELTWVTNAARSYLGSQMVGGKILQSGVVTQIRDGAYCHFGSYYCSELIGKVHIEEILKRNG